MQKETNPDGALRYGAGSIAIHVIDREFATRMAGGVGRVVPNPPGSENDGALGTTRPTSESTPLPFHRADKKIATIDAADRPVKPEKANGVKFEMFVFDALPFAANSIVIETARADDFSPVKNAEGVDSPQTCRDDQLRQFARWLKAAGAAVETDATGLPQVHRRGVAALWLRRRHVRRELAAPAGQAGGR
jgi:UDP-N-acetylglucosamine/UDP-N-acetylgalactosamine diphosphorylase